MRNILSSLAVAGLVAAAACQDPNTIAAPDVAPAAWDLVGVCNGISMPYSQCAALVSVYNATGGDGWDDNTNWGTDPNPCTWFGVVCTAGDHGSVLELNLRSNGLTGTIPAAIAQLIHVQQLRLGHNELGGPLPAALFTLDELVHLELTNNHHTGTLPPEIGNLASLEYLFLIGNEFSGPIPAELAQTSLVAVYLESNRFSGTIPPELGSLPGLISLVARFNNLSGIVPPEVAWLGEDRECWLSENPDLSVPDTPEYRALDTDGDGLLCQLPFSSDEEIGDDAVGGIDELVPDPLNEGLANALKTKIENAMAKAAAGQYQAAINQMRAFIGQVEDLVAGGTLTQEQAEPFLQQAQALIDLWTAEL